jgi:hypothetical protein
MQSCAAHFDHAMTPNALKTKDFQARPNQGCFFAAQRNTLYEPVLGIDGSSRLKKRNFLLKLL